MWLIDTAHQIAILRWGYRIFVQKPGNFTVLLQLEW